MIKIAFLVQQLSQPRCIKRIESFKNAGVNIEVYGFDNDLYNENLKKIPFEINEIWKIDKNLSRLKKAFLYRSKIRQLLKKQDEKTIIYAFGFEIGAIVSFVSKNRFIYEEADLTAARFNNKIMQNIFNLIDRRNIKKAACTILTSRGFIDYIYPKGEIGKSKIFFFENKLHPSFKNIKKPKKQDLNINQLKFGFVGLIRYPNTILRFAKIIGECFPQHEFHFFGDCEPLYSNMYEDIKFSNVFKHGKFKNPQDLEQIYSKIDLNVVCYDTKSGNVRIAEPNKLYESIFFQKPIVVSKGTYLEERVRQFNSGYSIDSSKDDEIITFVNSLTYKSLNLIKMNLVRIDSKLLIDDSKVQVNRVLNNLNL